MAHKAGLLAHITLAFPFAAKAATVWGTPCYTKNFFQTIEDIPKFFQLVTHWLGQFLIAWTVKYFPLGQT